MSSPNMFFYVLKKLNRTMLLYLVAKITTFSDFNKYFIVKIVNCEFQNMCKM